MTKPTLEQLRDCWMEDDDGEGFEIVGETNHPDDHGYGFSIIFRRVSDNTYWMTNGVCQGGGDYHQLRELESTGPDQVYPKTKAVTVYERSPG